jgi:hypothetical protein
LFCTLFIEVTHNLGTQLIPTATPSKPLHPRAATDQYGQHPASNMRPIHRVVKRW